MVYRLHLSRCGAIILWWWRGNAERGITSIMLGYSLGKAQRIIKYLDRGVGDVVCYSTISETNRVLEAAGFDFGAWVDGSKGLDQRP
ncbi:MAG: hypothetical protein RLZZ47_701 [Bacteroidota bacterium]